MKKFNDFLNILIGAFFGVFIGQSTGRIIDYKLHPDTYSSEWYEIIIIYAIVSFSVIGLALIAKLIIKKKNNT